MEMTATEMVHETYTELYSRTFTGQELEAALVDMLVRRGYAKPYATRVVRDYLDA
jgi:hypothetical protein